MGSTRAESGPKAPSDKPKPVWDDDTASAAASADWTTSYGTTSSFASIAYTPDPQDTTTFKAAEPDPVASPRSARRTSPLTQERATSRLESVPDDIDEDDGDDGDPTEESAAVSRRRRGAAATSASRPGKPDRRFRGAVVKTIAGTIVPGLGFLGTRLQGLGIVLMTALVTGTLVFGFMLARNPALVAGNALKSGTMFWIAVGLAVFALLWVVVIVGTYLINRPKPLTTGKRIGGAILVALLSLATSGPMAVASAYSFETASLSGQVFESEDESQSQTRPTLDTVDPWADISRVNILLLGGDSGESRDESLGIRTDTMMLASIDTATGNTVIIQLPRNLQGAVFPDGTALQEAFPYGFDDGDTSMLNAIWNDVPAMYPELFTDTSYPGADALKWAVEGITGLHPDYFVMVNIDGLVNLVDAMGGVTLNVNFPIAKGGSVDGGDCGMWGYIPEGPSQLLNGDNAMWYARSRCNSPNLDNGAAGDFSRMERQSCLVDAVIAQADPATMLTRYEQIAQAAGEMIVTDIPQEHLSAMVELATRMQNAQYITRLPFVEGVNGYTSSYPDFDLMKQQVAAAIAETSADAQSSAQATTQPATDPTTATTETAQATDPATTQAAAEPTASETVSDACAYRHEEPLGDVPDSVPVYTPPASEAASTEGPR
ncbi:hypothetical protein GCM10009785_12270 [Brooklawnia cerclae]|uniref:LCP family protein required for cell wall assembly n=1 Tax=Brooklawnia cerclae TaxID=349934 RepID=A0ABX0SJE4_9ACTN|nr:LCP family protein required for cell wall assembly [Brooklawnia cerclae]